MILTRGCIIVMSVIISMIILVGSSFVPNEEFQSKLKETFIGNKVSEVVLDLALSNVNKI